MVQDRTSEFFDRYASDFDAIYGTRNTLFNRAINTMFRKSMRLRFQRSIAECDPIDGRNVIDIGCGPGHYAIALAERGAARVLGVDFAEGMIELARRRAAAQGVDDRCVFSLTDFMTEPIPETFDYAIAMGFMDYMPDPNAVVDRVLSMTTGKALFSFPADGGFLAWQRKLRYRRRCDLFLYTRESLEALFAGDPSWRVTIDRMERDYFVAAHRE